MHEKQCAMHTFYDIKIAKRNYYFHVFNMHKNNMKQTWRTITETLNKQVNSREIPTKIIHNDETLTDIRRNCRLLQFVFCKHWRSIVLFLRRVR